MSGLAGWDYDLDDGTFDPWGAAEDVLHSWHAGYGLRGMALGMPVEPISNNVPRRPAFFRRPRDDIHCGSHLGVPFQKEDPHNPNISPNNVMSDTTVSSDSDTESLLSQPAQLSGSRSAEHSPSSCLKPANTTLSKSVESLQAEVGELALQISSLRGEVARAKECYRQFIDRIPLELSNPVEPKSFLPFFHILQLVRDANSRLPEYNKKDYVGQYYWTEESFLDEKQIGILTVTRNQHSGVFSFLITESGVVASRRYQEKMFRFGRILLNTLRKYGMAPASWDDVDLYALEWFCLSIRVKFTEFRLCDDHWKAETFASVNYAKWLHPHSAKPLHVADGNVEPEAFSIPTEGHHRESQKQPVSPPDHGKSYLRMLSKTLRPTPPYPQFSLSDNMVPEAPQVVVNVTQQCLPAPLTVSGDRCAMMSRANCETTETTPKLGGVDTLSDDFVQVLHDENWQEYRGSCRPPKGTFQSTFFENTSLWDSASIAGEDPPDYRELKAEERERVVAFTEKLDRKREISEILKADATWKAKPRTKEKKKFHIFNRRSIGNFISWSLSSFEAERVLSLQESTARRRPFLTKAALKHHKIKKELAKFAAERKSHAEAEAAKRTQKEWERRPDIQLRLDSLVRYVDHVERAYRKEERLLLSRDYARQQLADRPAFLARHKARIEHSRAAHNDKMALKARFARMLPDVALYHGAVMKQRLKVFREKQASAAKMIEEKRKKREEQRAREAKEAAARTEAAHKALEAKLREAEERLATIRKQREKEYTTSLEEARLTRRKQREEESRFARRRIEREVEAVRTEQLAVPTHERTVRRQSSTTSVSSHDVVASPVPQYSRKVAPVSPPAVILHPKNRPGSLHSRSRQREAQKYSVLRPADGEDAVMERPTGSVLSAWRPVPAASVPAAEAKRSDGFDAMRMKQIWRPKRLEG